MLNAITHHISNGKAHNKADYSGAIADWKADLAWLKRT
jgi:hypothetical protein